MPRDSVPPTTPVKQAKPYVKSPPKTKAACMFIPKAHQSQLPRSSRRPPISRREEPRNPEDSALPGLHQTLNKMEEEANEAERGATSNADLVGVTNRYIFSRSRFERYLGDAKNGWVQREEYRFVDNDLAVYEQTRPNHQIHGTAKRLIIFKPTDALAGDQVKERGQRGASIITPSLWAYLLSTTLGGEPFFLFYRHGKGLEHLKYFGCCRLRYQQRTLTQQDWLSLSSEDRSTLNGLYSRLRNLEIQGRITIPQGIPPIELDPVPHMRIYIIEREGQAIPFFKHVRDAEASVLLSPGQIAMEAKGSAKASCY